MKIPTPLFERGAGRCAVLAFGVRAVVAGLLLAGPLGAAEFGISTASYLGSAADNDAVRGIVIQSDGTVVLAANIGTAQPGGVTPVLLNGATAATPGCVIRLSGDGRTVLSVTRLAAEVLDLAADDADRLYVAAGADGLFRLNPAADAVGYHVLAGNYAYRVDAAPGGTAACLVPSSLSDPDNAAGTGTIHVFAPDGAVLGSFAGKNNTQDVAVDETTASVFIIGWRQANAWGPPGESCAYNPVQIAYTRAYSYGGAVKWTGYDWSAQTYYNAATDSYDESANDCPQNVTDLNKINPRFLNRYKNNMADTRGYRITMGRDGYLYCGFEAAGGNHIFRDDPFDLALPGSIVGGDQWHQFVNTGASHKTYIGRYDPATGDIVLGNQFCSVTTSGGSASANALRIKSGGLAVDETGRIFFGGESAWALPFFPSSYYVYSPLREVFNPFGAWGYAGGAHFWVQAAAFNNRDYVTRLGFGTTRAVAARVLAGETAARIAFGGSLNLASGPAYVQDAIQPQPGYGQSDGFFAVLGGVTGGGSGAATYRFSYGEGANYGSGLKPRNADPVNTVTDLDGDGADDSVREYAFSTTTPLSPVAGYTGPAFFGGIRASVYDSTSLLWGDNTLTGSQYTLRVQPTAPVTTRMHGVIYFPKSSFAGLDPAARLSFSRDSLVYCNVSGATGGRWVVRDGGNFYVSETLLSASPYLSFANDADDGRWALWETPHLLDFDAAGAVFLSRNFSDIDGIGFLFDKDTPSSDRFLMSFSTLWAEFAVDAVPNQSPVAAFSAAPMSGAHPLTVAFDASASSDPDGTVSFFSWTFDNDVTSAGPTAATVYPAAGPYWPQLKIWDNNLATATTSRTVWVYGTLGGPTAMMAAALGGTMGTAEFQRFATVYNVDLDGDGQADDSTTGSSFSTTSPLGASSIEGTLLYGGFIAKNYDSQVNASDRGYTGSDLNLRIQGTGGGSTLHAVLYIDKSQFLNRAAHVPVTVDGTSSFKIAGIDRFELLQSVRWLIRDGGQFYVSESTITPSGQTATLTFPSATDHGRWAPFDPAATGMNFDAAGAVFATRQFTDITGIGLIVDRDTPVANRIWLSFAAMEFIAAFVSDLSPPVADFTAAPAKVDVFQTVTFDASASASAGGIVRYEWDLGDGTRASGVSVQHRYTTLGDKTVTLTVTDDLGQQDSVSKTYPVVFNAEPVPVIQAVPTSGVAPLSVAFDASASSDDGSIVLYEWDWDGDGVYDETGVTAGHLFHAVGYYVVRLRVTDDGGKSATTTVAISATNAEGKIPPVAVLQAVPTSGQAPLLVNFSGLASFDPNGTITAYAWDLDGDGEFDDAFTATTSRTFTSAGEFLVRLRVTDNEGASASASTTITVTVPPGAETLVNWSGDYVTANRKFRNGSPTITDNIDADGDGQLIDRRILYAYSESVPLSPNTSDYAASGAAPFYGGIRLEVLNSSSINAADEGILNKTPPPDWMSLRWQTNATGVAGRWHWVVFWDKADFLNGGDVNRVDFTANSKLEMGGIGHFDDMGTVRWLVRDGTQFYVSQATLSKGTGTATLTFASDASDGYWAPFDPAADINFDAAGATFAERDFSDVTAVGFVIDKDAFTAVRHWFDFSRFTMLGRTNPPLAGYDGWIANPAYGLSGDDVLPGADPDSDGMVNLIEYFFGTDPSQPDGHDQASLEVVDGVLKLRFPLNKTATDAAYAVEARATTPGAAWLPLEPEAVTVEGDLGAVWQMLATAPLGDGLLLRLSIWLE